MCSDNVFLEKSLNQVLTSRIDAILYHTSGRRRNLPHGRLASRKDLSGRIKIACDVFDNYLGIKIQTIDFS